MLITAAVFALASLPTFLFLRERARARRRPSRRRRMRSRACARPRAGAALPRPRSLVFACGTFYQAGVATVIALAAIYAEQVMGFKTQDTILLILVVNVTAAIGAFGFGYAQDRIGKVRGAARHAGRLDRDDAWWPTSRRRRRCSGWPPTSPGLCMGSSQSAGRALVGLLLAAGAQRPSSSACGAWRRGSPSILGPAHLRRRHLGHRRQPSPGDPPHRRILHRRARDPRRSSTKGGGESRSNNWGQTPIKLSRTDAACRIHRD